MKLTTNATYLSTLINGLKTNLLNELQSDSAKANADYLLKILTELLKREQCYPDILPEILDNGLNVIQQLTEALQAVSQDIPEQPAIHGNSLTSFNSLSTSISTLSNALGKSNADAKQKLALMRKAAEWECEAHNAFANITVDTIATENVEPLTRQALQDFIQSKHPDGDKVSISSFDRIMGGFGKQTWAINLKDGSGQNQPLIVRKCEQVPVCDHKSFILNREFDLLKILSQMDFPAPKPLWMGENVPGSDAPFYVMERLPGSPPGSYLEGSAKLPEELVLQWAEVMAKLHSYPLENFTGFIEKHESPTLLNETMEQCYQRTLADWRNYAENEGKFTCATLNYLFEWVSQNIPKDHSRPSLIHGDFGIHNMLTDQGKVTAILDWEAVTFGSPLVDLSYIKPKVEAQMDWQRFIQHYFDCGGPKVNLNDISFYQVYQLMFIMVPMNNAVGLVQSNRMKEARFTMFELGFLPQFMSNALAASQ